VWTSADGKEWDAVTLAADFAQAGGSQEPDVLNDMLWVISSGSAWSSPDGMDWQVRSTDQVAARASAYATTVFGDSMWVFGGYRGAAAANDVWRSVDGASWTEVTAAAAWSPRWGHLCEAIGDRLYLLGGTDGGQGLTDLWTSEDGATWTELSPRGTPPQTGTVTVSAVFQGHMYVIDGGRVAYYVP
jgi:hypothetical protein